MDALRQYVISVTAAAVVCSVVLCLLPDGSLKKVLKVICGLFLAFTVLKPISRVDFDQLLSDFSLSYAVDGEAAAAFGRNLSRESAADIIKEETEAYILDKAVSLNTALEVEVTVNSGELPVPESVELHGEVSAHIRQQLETIIEDELGISKENQRWTG